MARSQSHETDDGLAFHLVGARDHGRLGHARVAYERAFDLHRAEAMAGDFDDVVDAAEYPDVTVFVALGGVAREIDAGNPVPVFARVALVVAVDGAKHRWPGLLNCQVARLAGRHRLVLHVDDFRADAGKRQRGGARFRGRRTRQRRNHDRAGFRLPPGIDDRTAIFADGLEIPFPGRRIDRLTDRPQDTQTADVVFVDPFQAPGHECADRGGGAVENRDLVALDDLPETVLGRLIRRAFVHHDGGAVR